MVLFTLKGNWLKSHSFPSENTIYYFPGDLRGYPSSLNSLPDISLFPLISYTDTLAGSLRLYRYNLTAFVRHSGLS